MPHRTTQPTHSGKAPGPPLTWVKAACMIIGRRLHAVPDAIASRLDWQVTPTQWGLGREYRDPRFDRLGLPVDDPLPRTPRELP